MHARMACMWQLWVWNTVMGVVIGLPLFTIVGYLSWRFPPKS